MTAISRTVVSDSHSNLDFVMASLVTLLLAVQLLNLATFNHQPSEIRLLVDSASVLGYGVLVLLALAYARPATFLHLTGLILFCAAGFIGLAAYPEATTPEHFIEQITSPMVLGLLTMRRAAAPGRTGLSLLWFAAVAAAILAAGFALLEPPSTLAGIKRLAVFAGGEGGVHPSAYATACLFLTLLVLWRAKVGLGWVTVLVMGLLAFVIFKYQVRTVWLMLGVFAGFSVLYWLGRRSAVLVVATAGMALLGAAAVLFILVKSGFDIGHFSSGRTLIYVERFHLIASRDPLEFLFGSGSGTDMMRGVSAWRWAAKNSHNDFLIITIEFGLVGLLGFLMMIIAPIVALPPARKGWIVMMAASSLVSNGVLLRPSIGAPLVLIAWLSVALRERAQRAAQEQAWLEEEIEVDAAPLVGAYVNRGLARPARVSIEGARAPGPL